MTSSNGWIPATTRSPSLDFAARYQEMGDQIRDGMQMDIQTFCLELTRLLVANVSLLAEVEEALDKHTSMNVLGNMHQ